MMRRRSRPAWHLLWLLPCSSLSLGVAGCASYWRDRDATMLIEKGNTAQGLELLAALARDYPLEYRTRYLRARDAAIGDLLARAAVLRNKADIAGSRSLYEQVLALQPQQAQALQGLAGLERDVRGSERLAQAKRLAESGDEEAAAETVGEVLAENPDLIEARRLRDSVEIERNRMAVREPSLKAALRKPVALEFRDAPVATILEILSMTSGVSFVLDKDVRPDLKATIFAKQTTVEDALELVLRTNQLAKKALNDSSLLIYPAVDEKKRLYEDLVVRTFYLKSADPRKVQDLLRTIVAPKAIYVDERNRFLVVRDNLEVMRAVERLVTLYDVADPEVLLEIEVLEVNSDDLLNLGIQYPDSISLSISSLSPGGMTINQLRGLNSDSIRIGVPDPVAVLNLKQTHGNTQMLANPTLRVRNRQKAKILIGDKVPVITTTVNQTSSATTESVSYLDVGLKLEVEPEIHADSEVSIDIALEVSNIVKEIKSITGLLVYQIGTRNAMTTLRLRDGETQMLAGLIKDERIDSSAGIPGLSRIPVIGRLFSNQTNTRNKTEIVLLVTPHVKRPLAIPGPNFLEFPSGTGERVTTRPLRVNAGGVSRKRETPGGTQESDAAVTSPTVPRPEVDPVSTGTLRLNLKGPTSAKVAEDFDLLLGRTAVAADHVSFDVVFDQPGMVLRKAEPGSGIAKLDTTMIEGAIHVEATGVAAQAAELGRLVLMSPRSSGMPVSASIQNVSASAAGGMPVPASVGLPLAITIQP